MNILLLAIALAQSPIPPGICPVYCNKWICGWAPCEPKKICERDKAPCRLK